MFSSFYLSYTEKIHDNKKTLKQRFNNFIEIINFPVYYYYFYGANFLSPIVNLFVCNQKLKIATMSNKIYFKNKVYLRSFQCHNLAIIIIRFFLSFICLLHFYKTYSS